jgi:hypothetical protein
MKQFILSEFTDHTSVYGYQKKLAYVHLVADGDEIGQHNCVGYVKTEPIVAEDGTVTGEVYYYRGNAFPRHKPRYFATSRNLLAYMQANLSETAEDEAVVDFDEFSSMDPEEETLH